MFLDGLQHGLVHLRHGHAERIGTTAVGTMPVTDVFRNPTAFLAAGLNDQSASTQTTRRHAGHAYCALASGAKGRRFGSSLGSQPEVTVKRTGRDEG